MTYTRMRGEDRTKASGTLHIHYSLRAVFFNFLKIEAAEGKTEQKCLCSRYRLLVLAFCVM